MNFKFFFPTFRNRYLFVRERLEKYVGAQLSQGGSHAPSIVDRPPSTVDRPPSTVDRLPSTVDRPPSTVAPPPSTVDRPPSTVDRPPSTVDRRPSTVDRPPSTACRGLNLGTGEGDYDQMIAGYCTELIACDVNEEDLAHARALNREVTNLRYEANNALALTYEDHSFDLIVSCEVIEHVGKPEQMVREMYRVMKPGGIAILTFPSREFPVTYDPVNRIWQFTRSDGSREYAISQGAYAFGHDYLIGSADFKKWAIATGFEIVEFQGLSRHLVGLLEVYWTGIAQSIFKKNARNVTADTGTGLTVRPASTKEPALVFITDFVLWLDRMLFGWTNRSVGKGVVLRKPA